jgi:ArsR family transcriptional regulator, arsenate/arsenite/antimonite-responsive transcriptional repressor
MGATKNELFSARQNGTSVLLKALAHPARIAILELLLKEESCICGHIVDKLPLSQPTISQHLREMKEAGLILGSVEGNSICYCLNPDTLDKLRDYFSGVSEKLKKKSIACC